MISTLAWIFRACLESRYRAMSFIETHTESGNVITGVFERNEFYENQIGMLINGFGSQAATPIIIRENTVFGNDIGVEINSGYTLVEGNTLRNNLATGLRYTSGNGGASKIVDNEIYLNGTGVDGGWYYNLGSLEVTGNRIYANLGTGVSVAGPNPKVESNTIYSNAIGIASNWDYLGTNARIANNLVYANIDFGVVLESSNGEISSNTIRQSAGAAIRPIIPTSASPITSCRLI